MDPSPRAPGSRPSLPAWALVLAGLLLLPVGVLVVTWAATNVGTAIALVLAAVVWVPPFVLVWDWARADRRAWRSDRHFQRDLRWLLDHPPTGG